MVAVGGWVVPAATKEPLLYLPVFVADTAAPQESAMVILVVVVGLVAAEVVVEAMRVEASHAPGPDRWRAPFLPLLGSWHLLFPLFFAVCLL